MADDELTSRIDGCEGDLETTLEESDGEVVITVVSTTRSSDDGGRNPVTVVLSQPLGDRQVVDGKTGDEVPPTEG